MVWRPEDPTQARGLGVADASSGVQGQSPVRGPAPGNEMNLPFLREIFSLPKKKSTIND